MALQAITQVAKSVPFDNATNGFIADDTQAAIEEAKSLRTKSGNIAPGTFAGNPKKATVTFATNYPSLSYSIFITGFDARFYTYESKLVGGFVINCNANQVLTGDVHWETVYNGEDL